MDKQHLDYYTENLYFYEKDDNGIIREYPRIIPIDDINSKIIKERKGDELTFEHFIKTMAKIAIQNAQKRINEIEENDVLNGICDLYREQADIERLLKVVHENPLWSER